MTPTSASVASLESLEDERTCITTIVARNYIPYACALGESLREHFPGTEFWVLVVDGVPDLDIPGIQFIEPRDIGFSDSEVAIRSFIYDVKELATSYKAALLRHVLMDASCAVFLDPDTQVFGDFSAFFPQSEIRPIVVTPHRLTPPPLDGLEPGEDRFKRYGVYNLGFLSVAKGAEQFLDWWDERLSRYATNRPSRTLFTDQRWIDLAPSYFEVEICRHPGMNVAPWNLDERPIHRCDGALKVEDSPLLLAHFSSVGTNLESSEGLLNSQRSWERASLDSRNLSAFADLARAWWQRVSFFAENLGLTSEYGLGKYASGQNIRRLDRRWFYYRVLKAEALRKPPPKVPHRSVIPRFIAALDRIDTLCSYEGFSAGFAEDLRRWRRRSRG